MPQNNPTASAVHVNRPLTNMSIASIQDESMFVATRAMPAIAVAKRSDEYFVYNQADQYRDRMQRRAPGTPAAQIGYGITTDTYRCESWAAMHSLDEQTRANYDTPLNAEQDAVIDLTQAGLISRELDFVNTFMADSVWSNERAGVTGTPNSTQFRVWSDFTNSDPVVDVRGWQTAIQRVTGRRPNRLGVDRPIVDKLMDHPKILDRIEGGATNGNPAIANLQTLAAVMGLDEIFVLDGVVNSANEGATESTDFIGNNRALLYYAPSNAQSLRTRTAGLSINWAGYVGATGNNLGMRIKRYLWEEDDGAIRIEAIMSYTHKVVDATLGLLATNVLDNS